MAIVNIRVYSTHIKVFPYHLGDCVRLEKMLSKYDGVYHTYVPLGYYIDHDILYLPRGISLSLLQDFFGAVPTMVPEYDQYVRIKKFNMKYEPRGQIQKDSIDFLTSQNRFGNGFNRAQYGLNLDTGDGKTFCCISAVSFFKLKTIVITHKTVLKKQWREEFLSKTDIEDYRIVDIDGSAAIEDIMKGDLKGDIYIVNHQTLQAYCRINQEEEYSETTEYDWNRVTKLFKKMKIGIKVVDEAHKFFENSLKIDYFTNVYKSFYLTATFTRNDAKEKRIFKMAYQSMYRFGEETLNYEEKRKHIQLVNVMVRSNPIMAAQHSMRTAYGFSSYKYIDYELNNNPDNTLMKAIISIVNKVSHLEGRILINSPTIESVEHIATEVEKETGIKVGTIHSKNTKEENLEHYQERILSSTIKSIGEGDNIEKLRVLINVEPIGSDGLADQLRGRLREYSEDKDTYLFYIIDTSVKITYNYLQRIMPTMKRKCKQINMIRLDV